MARYLLIILIFLSYSETRAQYTYHGRVISEIRKEPVIFGTVRLPSSQRGGRNGRYGKELAKIDSLGNFTFSLKDTSNVWIVVDCVLGGMALQRISYTDSVFIVAVKSTCYEFDSDRARKDISENNIYLLCSMGYYGYLFNSKDTAFEKKYGVKYYSFGDQPINYDCMWLYNKTVAEYLDSKFGEAWRKEVRWDVPMP